MNQPERKSHAGQLPVRIVLRCPGPGLAVLLLETRHKGRRHVVVHADLQHLIAAHQQSHLPRRRVLQNLDAGLWIRIRSGFNRVSGSGSRSRRAKMTHKSSKKITKFSCFEVLVLFRELKASFVTWTSIYGGLGIGKL